MSQSPGVLIVESRADEREVLSTVLARHGLRIWEAAAAEEGAALAQEHHPAVIVIDADSETADAYTLAAQLSNTGSAPEPSLIILGQISLEKLPPESHVVAKPYHFAPLIRKIEQLAAKAA